MIERLTKKIDGGYTLNIPKDKSLSDLEIKFAVYDKLGKYEDAEDNGILATLPCKPGDTVYAFMPHHIEEGYYEGEVQSVVIDKDGSYATINTDMLTGNWCIPFDWFGKTAFMSQEKAEALFQESIRQEER